VDQESAADLLASPFATDFNEISISPFDDSEMSREDFGSRSLTETASSATSSVELPSIVGAEIGDLFSSSPYTVAPLTRFEHVMIASCWESTFLLYSDDFKSARELPDSPFSTVDKAQSAIPNIDILSHISPFVELVL